MLRESNFSCSDVLLRPLLILLTFIFMKAKNLTLFSGLFQKMLKRSIIDLKYGLILLVLLFSSTFLGAQVGIEVEVDKNDVFTCETMKYTLKYRCAGTTGNCTNVTMTASAPSGMVFPVQTVGLTTDIASYTFSADRRSVTFMFKEPLLAGNTGIIELTGQGECGLADGTVTTLTGSIQSGSGTPTTASVNTTLHSSNKFCPNKSQGSGLALDYPTNYIINLISAGIYGEQGIGTTSLTNVVMVDNLPPNTVINSVLSQYTLGGSFIPLPSGTCIIDNTPTAPKIICTFPDIAFQHMNNYGSYPQVFVNVTYPDANFNAGDNVTNSVTVNYTPLGGTPQTSIEGSVVNYVSGTTYANRGANSCTANLDVTDPLANPNAEIDGYKRSGNTTIKPGENVEFTVDIKNTGNIPLTNVVLEDIIPSDLVVYQLVKSGTFSGFTTTPTPRYWIKTVSNPTYTEILFGSGYTYNIPTGEIVTHVKVEVDNMPSGSLIQYVKILVNLKPGSTATTIQNCVNLTATEMPTEKTPTNNCHTLTVLPADNFSTLQISKVLGPFAGGLSASFYGAAQSPGATVWSNIEAANLSGGQALQNPVIVDLLPVGLTYDNLIQYSSSCMTPAQADNVEIINNYQGSGQTLIRMSWNNPWPQNCLVMFLNNLVSLQYKIKINEIHRF